MYPFTYHFCDLRPLNRKDSLPPVPIYIKFMHQPAHMCLPTEINKIKQLLIINRLNYTAEINCQLFRKLLNEIINRKRRTSNESSVM